MTISRGSLTIVAASFIALCTSSVSAQTFGNTHPDNAVGPFGRDALLSGTIKTVAETFVTPVGSPLLQSFSFYLTDNFGGSNLIVQASIFQFTNNRIIGSSVFSSALRFGSSNIFDYDALSFSGLNLMLTPATNYALLLRTASSSPDGSTNFVGTTTGESFGLGQLFTSTGVTDAELGTAGAFSMSNAATFGTDAALQMTFGSATVTSTPEPGSAALLIAGLVVVGFVRRRRSTKAS